MENNIYIGNRYVPILANPIEWDNLREYESLTIVTYNGTAYTSRKRVPAGTALSNSEYWAVTGNYNAQVEQYREETEAVARDLAGFMESVDSDIDTLTDNIDLLNLGTIVCIGDSYLEGYTPTGNVTPWGDVLAGYLGKTLNTDYYKFYYGGIGFATTVDSKNFGTLLSDANTAISDKNSVGAIFVLGGANEPNNSNVTTNIESFVTNAKSYFPNAKVYYGYGSTFIETTPYKVNQVNSLYQQANSGANCMGNLAKFLTAYHELYYHADGRHPNANGQKILAKLILQCLAGCGVGSVYRPERTVAGNILETISDDMWRLQCWSNTHANIPTVESHTSNGATLLYSIPRTNSYLSKTDSNFYQTTGMGFMRSNSTEYRMCYFRLVFKPDVIEVYDICMNDSHTNYLTSNVEYFEISAFNYELPVALI